MGSCGPQSAAGSQVPGNLNACGDHRNDRPGRGVAFGFPPEQERQSAEDGESLPAERSNASCVSCAAGRQDELCHISLEGLDEVALIPETGFGRDLRDELVGGREELSGGAFDINASSESSTIG